MWEIHAHAQIWEDTPNRPFLSLLQPLFQGESTCEVFVMNISFISIEIRINYHDKNFATRLASKERLVFPRSLTETTRCIHVTSKTHALSLHWKHSSLPVAISGVESYLIRQLWLDKNLISRVHRGTNFMQY